MFSLSFCLIYSVVGNDVEDVSSRIDMSTVFSFLVTVRRRCMETAYCTSAYTSFKTASAFEEMCVVVCVCMCACVCVYILCIRRVSVGKNG